MSVSVAITIPRDAATPAIMEKVKACDPHRLATRMAVPLAKHWRNHLAKKPQNRNGYPSTGFWEDAARRVVGLAEGPAVRLYSDKLGLRQRYYGGPIDARRSANLTIPICAEAYGTTAKDWGNHLTLVILADGRKFLALWLGSEANRQVYHNTVGKAIESFNKGKAAGKIQVRANERKSRAVGKFRDAAAGEHPKVIVFKSGGTPNKASKHMDLKFLFKLQPHVDQQADPTVVPPDLGDVAMQAMMEAIETA